MIKQIATLLLVIISLSVFSQSVIITGKAEQQPQQLVRIISYADEFSNLEKTIAKTETDTDGNFSLQFEINQTQFAFLALGLEKGEFYLTPGSSYSIFIPNDTSESRGSIFDRLPLRFSISADDGGVQKSIEDFNIEYNDFIYNNINSIYRSRDKSVVTQFVSVIKEKYSNNISAFVKNYVDYSVASLLWLSKKENNQKILVNYFINRPVLYSNIQYADFFKEFFKDYFNSENTFRYEDLIPAINSIKTVGILDRLLTRDTLLVDDNRVREIVTMLLLSRYYHDRNVDKVSVITRYKEIADGSDFIENRRIANNFVLKLQFLQNGTIAPDFNLADINDSNVSLKDFNNKFLLLSFVKEDCKICEFQMKLISDIQKQNGNSFDIVTIVAGDEITKLSEFANQRGTNWPILKTGKDLLLLEKYDIRAYPSYILINPDGTIAYAQLPMPDESMELYIQRFIDQYNKP
ncbi:MAG: TlpA family protein disulfide reductase [Bacteroidetes bacterium]|nr:TlpA family protein disulfide reductase [Bacteroidota bacterium]